jgi:hypothetical protein
MTRPTIPSGSTIEATIDPTTISDQYLFDLHEVISRESTRRWKKVIKEGSWVEKLKEEKRNMLQECREEVRQHEGTKQMPEVQNSLEGFKELIGRLIKISTKHQQQGNGTSKRKRGGRTTTQLGIQGDSKDSREDSHNHGERT